METSRNSCNIITNASRTLCHTNRFSLRTDVVNCHRRTFGEVFEIGLEAICTKTWDWWHITEILHLETINGTLTRNFRPIIVSVKIICEFIPCHSCTFIRPIGCKQRICFIVIQFNSNMVFRLSAMTRTCDQLRTSLNITASCRKNQVKTHSKTIILPAKLICIKPKIKKICVYSLIAPWPLNVKLIIRIDLQRIVNKKGNT